VKRTSGLKLATEKAKTKDKNTAVVLLHIHAYLVIDQFSALVKTIITSDCNPEIPNPGHFCQSDIPGLAASQSCDFGITKIG